MLHDVHTGGLLYCLFDIPMRLYLVACTLNSSPALTCCIRSFIWHNRDLLSRSRGEPVEALTGK